MDKDSNHTSSAADQREAELAGGAVVKLRSKERQRILDDAAELDAMNAATRKRFGLGPVVPAERRVPVRKLVRTVEPVGSTAGPVKSAFTASERRSCVRRAKRIVKAWNKAWSKERATAAEMESLRVQIFETGQRGFVRAVCTASGVSPATVYQLRDVETAEITMDTARRLRAALKAGITVGTLGGRPKGYKRTVKRGGPAHV